jgi:hypothetical protein
MSMNVEFPTGNALADTAKKVEVDGFRQANPGMPYLDIEKLVLRERPAVMAAAKAECDARLAGGR